MRGKILASFLIWLLFCPLNVTGQDTKKHEVKQKEETVADGKFIGFEDKNNDGINDKFLDADGDGRNDIDDKAYPHTFEFKDKNKDKINDLWVDRDGDGVNDLSHKLKGEKHLNIHFNVLDVDEDGRNDITGESYDREKPQWKGEVWGFWDESTGKLRGRFIDEDGDGIDDRLKDFHKFMRNRKHARGSRDVFIDEDGDGICDPRTDFIGMMGRKGRRHHHGGRKDGGGHH
jgi:hypothetical protein